MLLLPGRRTLPPGRAGEIAALFPRLTPFTAPTPDLPGFYRPITGYNQYCFAAGSPLNTGHRETQKVDFTSSKRPDHCSQ